MKLFGTVKSFDTIKDHGEIKPEVGSDDILPFEKERDWVGKGSSPDGRPASFL